MNVGRILHPRVATAAAVVVLAGVLAACGGGDTGPGTDPSSAPATPSSSATAGAATDDRPLAPDFTLTLQPEGEFVLSEADKPVYLVFWAEW